MGRVSKLAEDRYEVSDSWLLCGEIWHLLLLFTSSKISFTETLLHLYLEPMRNGSTRLCMVLSIEVSFEVRVTIKAFHAQSVGLRMNYRTTAFWHYWVCIQWIGDGRPP